MPAPSERRFGVAAYLFQAAALLVVLIPFLRFNNLQEWDFPGQFAAIWHLKNHLLPWPSGWNPYFYCGYPQGLFYPPLAHYLAAVAAIPLGITLSLKVLVASAVLLLPAAFYAFSRRFGLSPLPAFACSAWMTALLFQSGKIFDTWNLGSDLQSMLNVGLFANTLSLPILFAFLAVCGDRIDRNNWRWAAFLLGLLLLLHPFSSLVACIFLASLVTTQLLHARGRALDWKPLIWTPAAALLVGALWVLPYLAFKGYMSPEPVGSHWSTKVQLIVFNGIILALASWPRTVLRSLLVTYIALANFAIIGTMWGVPLQFTRFTIFLFFLLPVFLFTHIRSRQLNVLLIALAVVLGIYGYRNGELNARGVPNFNLPDFGRVEGRILSVVPSSHVPALHVYHDLIPVRTGNKSVLGLFIESSANGRFLADLTRSIEPEAYIWGTPTEVVNPEVLGKDYPQYIRERLQLFDIRHIYTDLKLENLLDPSLARSKRYINSYPSPRTDKSQEAEKLSNRYNLRGNQLDFYLYPMGQGALAQALSYVPTAPESDWKLTNQHWFLEMRGVPIFTDSQAPKGVRGALPGERVDIISTSENMDRLVLKIDAAERVPILVKVGYFPTWRLTIDGSTERIYRASPSLILFYGKGEAILEYHRPWLEYAGLALSLLGVAAILLLR